MIKATIKSLLKYAPVLLLLLPGASSADLLGGSTPSAPWGGTVVVPTTASVNGPFNAKDIAATFGVTGASATFSGASNVALTLGATGASNRTGLSVSISGNGGTTKSIDLTTTPGGAAPNVYGILATNATAAGTYSSYAINGVANASQAGSNAYGGNFTGTSNGAGNAYGVWASATSTSGNAYGLYVNAGKFGLNPQTLPLSMVSGDFYYDSSSQAVTGIISGATETLDGTLWTMTVSSSINTTATEGTIISSASSTGGLQTGIGTTLLPANFFTVGKTIYGVISGTYTTTGTPSLDIKVKLGATTILDTGIVTQVAVTGTDVFTVNFTLTCRVSGSSGKVMAAGQTVQNTNTIGSTGMDLNSTLSSIDTTAAQHLSITATWGASSASNNITFTNGFLQVKN